MIEDGLFKLITQDAAVQAAVGLDANGVAKAHWVLAPQGASLPMLVCSRVGTIDPYTMAGPLGMREAVFQVVAYASTYYASRSVANTVRTFLQNYKGTLPDADATVVKAVFTVKDWDDRFETGSKGFVFAAYLQFKIFFLA